MTLSLELNDKQGDALRRMLERGLYGANATDAATRILDRTFIDFVTWDARPTDDDREPWQRGGDGE